MQRPVIPGRSENPMKIQRVTLLAVALAAIGTPVVLMHKSHASDHADTPTIAANPGTDLTDVFAFPSPANPSNVVLVMNVHPLIKPGEGPATSFDPNVLYQFKLDTSGDYVEDKVIQVKFTGTGPTQTYTVTAPVHPSVTGNHAMLEKPLAGTGTLNATFTNPNGMKVFCGAREDPFFFDLEQFFTIFPDRATPLTGTAVADPNNPKATSWRAPGTAVDFLSNGGYNVLSIVVEMPRTLLVK